MEENTKIKLRDTVLEKVRPVESVQEWWEERSKTILRVSQMGGDPQEIMRPGGGMIRCRRL